MEKAAKKIGFIIVIPVAIVIIVFIVNSIINWNPGKGRAHKNNIREYVEVTGAGTVDSLMLISAINRGGQYLSSILLDNGKFRYRINLDSTVNVKPRYNTLRHAGSIYALSMYYDLTGDIVALQTAEKAARFLIRNTVKPISGVPGVLGIWTLPEIVHDKDPPELKLGGTGLGLVALCSLRQSGSNIVSLDTLKKLGMFLLYMQKKDGSFYSKYYPHRKGRDDSWTSLYYPGEAALGLLMLYELDPQKKWLEAATDAIEYLDRIRKGKTIVEADHWALIASELLLKNIRKKTSSGIENKIITHAMTICRSMINEKANIAPESLYYGCFTPDGRTTPTSTRLEGLLSAIVFIPLTDTAAIKFIINSINNGMEFTIDAQVKKGPHTGGMTRAYVPATEINSGVFRGGDKRNPEIRIDYVQHALSAWIQYYNLLYKHD